MKILIHADEYYPTAQACAYRMQVIADALVSAGYSVTVIASSANKKGCAAAPNSRKEKILYAPAIQMKKKTAVMRLLNNLSFALTSFFVSLAAGKADVVITTSPPLLISISGWLIARCKRALLVYDVRDIWPDVAIEMGSISKTGMMSRVFQRIANYMYRRADIVTTVSHGKVQKLQRYVANLSGDDHTGKVWLVSNGFDERVINSPTEEDVVRHYDMDRVPSCVYIGNIGVAQGLNILLHIAENTKHREIRFLCFGTGAERDVLERQAAENGLKNVTFCGAIEHDKVNSILSHAKLSFIPLKSGSMRDSIPTKLYEALGLGCPVLLAAEGDATDLLDDIGLGKHVPPEQADLLTETFDDMLDHYDIYVQHRQDASRLVRERYSRQQAAKSFAEKLNEYINVGL